MPKIKTRKSLERVLKKRKSGVITLAGRKGKKHNTGKKNAKYNRKKRASKNLSTADRNRLKNVL